MCSVSSGTTPSIAGVLPASVGATQPSAIGTTVLGGAAGAGAAAASRGWTILGGATPAGGVGSVTPSPSGVGAIGGAVTGPGHPYLIPR